MKLTLQEIFIIRLHKLLAGLLRFADQAWRAVTNFVILFSSKAKAVRLMRTGEIFEVQGETETARDYFERALQKSSKLFELDLNLCRCHLRLLSLTKAKEHGSKFLTIKPDSPEGLLYMGVILYYENKIEEALEKLEWAASLMPPKEKKKASALEYMGECYMKLQLHEAAVDCLEKAIKMNPSGSEKKYVTLGEGYYALNKKEEALNEFKRALAINERNYEAWNNIGVLMWSVGNLDNALKYFKMSLDIKPDYIEAQANSDQVKESMKTARTYGSKKAKR